MAQQDYGAAQPIANWVKKYVAGPAVAATSLLDKRLPPKKADTSWHDEMVKRANASFQKKDAASRPKILKKTDRKRNTGKKMSK